MSYEAITVKYTGPGRYSVRWGNDRMRVSIDDTLPQSERRAAAARLMIERHGASKHKAARWVEGGMPDQSSVFVMVPE